MYTFPVFVAAAHVDKTVKELIASPERLIWPFCDGTYPILDRPGPHRRGETYRQYRLANLTTNAREESFYALTQYEYVGEHSLVSQENPGTLSNIREITDRELYTMLRPRGQPGNCIDLLRCLPASMQTCTFLLWLQQTFPEDRNPHPVEALIMTGEQFNHYYPGEKVCLLDKNMINNNSQCQIGPNEHPDFSAITDYTCGYHVVERSALAEWQEYYDENIRLTSRDRFDVILVATIPADATVDIEYDITRKRLTRYKTSHVTLG